MRFKAAPKDFVPRVTLAKRHATVGGAVYTSRIQLTLHSLKPPASTLAPEM
jgi:hypothetical protein